MAQPQSPLYTAVYCKLLQICSDKVIAGDLLKQALDRPEGCKTEVLKD